jgi:hypothetical protein
MVLLRVFMLRAGLILCCAAALTACDVGEVDIGGGGTVDAPITNSAKAMMFDSTIKPMAETMGCVTAICHGGAQPPVLTSYTSLGMAYKTGPGATNILVTKGGTPPPGTHSAAPYFDTNQRATVAAWIDMAP